MKIQLSPGRLHFHTVSFSLSGLTALVAHARRGRRSSGGVCINRWTIHAFTLTLIIMHRTFIDSPLLRVLLLGYNSHGPCCWTWIPICNTRSRKVYSTCRLFLNFCLYCPQLNDRLALTDMYSSPCSPPFTGLFFLPRDF